ncbi:50S ribosomal protein L25 [Patescibacteria group bacterium]|nr:50S ribosomal protein L25 [Patescibacteria group bacterium]MBU1895601.1 50S ribosomal protein L25 [Patescibacteria group bacterium]
MELREDGIIPAVVYGPEIKTISIGVNYKEFEKLHNEAGESSLIDCIVEGEKDPITVLIQDLQIEPLKGRIIHVDFRQIKMGEEMNATVELEFVGESVAVKEQGGTLIQNYEEVNVKCLPSNLVSHINVDLSKLATFDEVIKIKDLVLPEGITVLDDPEGLVAKVAQPLTDEQFKAMETEGDKGVESVEVEGEKKEEGEEGAGVEGEKKDEKVENEKKEDKKEEKK